MFIVLMSGPLLWLAGGYFAIHLLFQNVKFTDLLKNIVYKKECKPKVIKARREELERQRELNEAARRVSAANTIMANAWARSAETDRRNSSEYRERVRRLGEAAQASDINDGDDRAFAAAVDRIVGSSPPITPREDGPTPGYEHPEDRYNRENANWRAELSAPPTPVIERPEINLDVRQIKV